MHIYRLLFSEAVFLIFFFQKVPPHRRGEGFFFIYRLITFVHLQHSQNMSEHLHLPKHREMEISHKRHTESILLKNLSMVLHLPVSPIPSLVQTWMNLEGFLMTILRHIRMRGGVFVSVE
jgi:hypothetical protein